MFKIGQEVIFTKYYPDLFKIKQRLNKTRLCISKNPELFNKKQEEYYKLQDKISKELRNKLTSSFDSIYITNDGFVKVLTGNEKFMYIKPNIELEKPVTGTFCGYKLQKTIRIYKRRDLKLDLRRRLRETTETVPELVSERFSAADQLSGRYSQNIRIDNPRHLSKIAIIAISPTVRMEVPMENLIINNKPYNFL